MTKALQQFMITSVLVLNLGAVAFAQASVQVDKTPVKVQVVISTYQGDRKVSSMPYTLLATADGTQATFNMGANVPIRGNGGNITYTNIGTTIRCIVTTEASGSFKVWLNVADKSVIEVPAGPIADASGKSDLTSFHDFNYDNTVTLKEGETKQVISASDKVNGEVTKIDVTLTSETTQRAAVRMSPDSMSANLTYSPMPAYPALARTARVEGIVTLQATVAENGSIKDLKIISNSNPLLVPGVVDTVKTWKYKPTLANGVPVEVMTTITIPFTLK